MAKKTWTLTDVDRDVYVEELSLTPDDVAGAAKGYSVKKRTLRGGLRDGVDVIDVDNGSFRFILVPTRGMGIWRAWASNVELGWKSPVKGPVHPKFVPISEAGGLGWLNGFDELLVRCGLESNGSPEFGAYGLRPYSLHGKIANLPAHRVEVSIDGDSGEIVVTGVVDESRLFGDKLRLTSTVRTKPGDLGLRITDQITNLAGENGELELLYHTNFGPPLLEAGAKVVVPINVMAPRDDVAAEKVRGWDTYDAGQPGVPEYVYFFDLAATGEGRTRALLRNAAGNRGVSLQFNKRQFPCFTLWKNHQTAADGYVTGLEPGINFPNRRSFEKQAGRVAVLKPGETRTFDLALEVHPNTQSVAAAEQAVAAIQAGAKPQIHDRPLAEWSA
jgi:galactose mutarotase-like enzyme